MPAFLDLPVTGLESEAHRPHQIDLHRLIRLPAMGDVGDLAVSAGPGFVNARQAHYRPAASVLDVPHTAAGPVVIDLTAAVSTVFVHAAADIDGIQINNDTVHGAMIDIWIVLIAVADITVQLAGIGEIVTLLPVEDYTIGRVHPFRWISLPSGTGTTVGGETTGPGTITGSVTRETEGPESGVDVDLHLASDDTLVSTRVTSAAGSFGFDTLTPDTYYVRIVAPSGATFTDTTTEFTSPDLTVVAGQTLTVAAVLTDATPGPGTATMSANSATWEWTTTDPTAPALIIITATPVAVTPVWLWQKKVDGTGWVDIDMTGIAAASRDEYRVTADAKDPNGNPLYGVNQTVYQQIRVSDDNGSTWSVGELMTIHYNT